MFNYRRSVEIINRNDEIKGQKQFFRKWDINSEAIKFLNITARLLIIIIEKWELIKRKREFSWWNLKKR